MVLPCGTERRAIGHRRRHSRASGRVAVLAAAAFLLSSCSSRPSRETVTTELGRQPSLPTNARPVVLAPRLPPLDAEVEAAGDRVAEALTHVKHRRGAAALRALGEARTGARGAMNNPARDDRKRRVLAAAVAEMEAAERSIQRGSWAEATAQLTAVNKGLDSLNTPPGSAP